MTRLLAGNSSAMNITRTELLLAAIFVLLLVVTISDDIHF